MAKKPVKVLIANPRGFCAGVQRAIEIVEKALRRFGTPVYVRHEIVHNRFVVEGLQQKGAIFVDTLDDVPAGAPVIFSAHGVPKSVPAAAKRRNMLFVDATCPLVSKVHREAEHHQKTGLHTILIGHAGHPEVIGTMGQLEDGAMTLVETLEDVAALNFDQDTPLAYVTQTTLSLDDTAEIVRVLTLKYPHIATPKKEDICYATTNRQVAVKALAEACDRVIVIGSPNSSNSLRLVEVAERGGALAKLVQRATNIDWNWISDARTIGITAGASAPEILVDEVIQALGRHFDITIDHVTTSTENITFKLPAILLKDAG
jgi:4-hydroxy-3-methylbut-2-en-1-yl diphosphate reductase